jgi:hypothetical protein
VATTPEATILSGKRFDEMQPFCSNPTFLYVVARHGRGDPEVLCVSCESGERTLPLFVSRKAARRFLRSSSLQLGSWGSEWRVRKLFRSELASLIFGLYAEVRRVALDPSPENLVGCYEAMSMPMVGELVS